MTLQTIHRQPIDPTKPTVAIAIESGRQSGIIAMLAANRFADDLDSINIVFVEDEDGLRNLPNATLAATPDEVINRAIDARVTSNIGAMMALFQDPPPRIVIDNLTGLEASLIAMGRDSFHRMFDAIDMKDADILVPGKGAPDAKDKRPGHLKGHGGHITSMRRAR